MFGLDDAIASHSDGGGLLIVALVAILLGLRHATDPDHLVAMTTLAPSEPGRSRAARLGASWGAGHALTLFAFGLPIVVFDAFLPDRLQQGAETVVDDDHQARRLADRPLGAVTSARAPTRTASGRTLQAFFVGLVHGVGGSAGVGLLLIATIDSQVYGVIALALLATFGRVDDAGDDGFRVGARAGTTCAGHTGVGVGGIAFGVCTRRRSRARAVRVLVRRSRIRSRGCAAARTLKRALRRAGASALRGLA